MIIKDCVKEKQGANYSLAFFRGCKQSKSIHFYWLQRYNKKTRYQTGKMLK